MSSYFKFSLILYRIFLVRQSHANFWLFSIYSRIWSSGTIIFNELADKLNVVLKIYLIMLNKVYLPRHDSTSFWWYGVVHVAVETFQWIAAPTTSVVVQLNTVESHGFFCHIQGDVGWILQNEKEMVHLIYINCSQKVRKLFLIKYIFIIYYSLCICYISMQSWRNKSSNM